MTAVAALAAWFGGSMIVLSDGRRGLATGLVLVAVGFAALTYAEGQIAGAAVLLAAGLVAAGLRLRSGPIGWGLMEPGSTPRIILIVVAGLLALWIGAAVVTDEGAPLRFAALSVLALMGARLLQGAAPTVALSAASALALGIGGASGLAEAESSQVTFAFAIGFGALAAIAFSGPNRAEANGA